LSSQGYLFREGIVDEQARQRRVEGVQQRVPNSAMRTDLLSALGQGDELSARELRTKLPGNPSLSVVNYHLLVLGEAEIVERVGGLYRLA
jgi:hypothetical protein